ncbi:CDP-glycerol glycerophosphotransferase family protein [Ornithinimicrobium avium]|uniref:Glycosyl/glycerophosphate transferase n=1 Tax=Ornithinimicrobium avium TaxID=2283195 RepID=A0A345NNZ7_9MICO|nr:CDP-glycerol glycerophosphotransferase family protein [Ornithinimicrobium avium]AXH96755.1 hypothetical protein DV701_12060 [Ornithinimicrobium avium]
MTLHPICEYLDLPSGEPRLRVAVRLRFADRPEGERYLLRCVDRRGRPVARAVAEVTPRVNTVGTWTRSQLVFEVPAGDLPDGSVRLEVAAAAPGATAYPVQPSAGLLAASRRTRLRPDRWVQAVPAAGRAAVWLRLASDTRLGRLSWIAADWLRELAFVAHARRFTWVRAARLATRPFVPRGPVWLVGERPETARDNGRALFEHLRTTRPDAPVYYVITADSPMRGAVEPLGNVVTHSSWRHRVLMLHAQVLANAYSVKHMLPSRWHPGAYMKQAAWRTGAHRVYLKHGVHLSPYAVKRANGGYDLLAAVGDREAEALRATSGYDEEVVVTGLARYDALVRPAERSGTVLFMPTWRRYLVPTLFSGNDESQVAYEGSTYQRFVTDLLGSPRLAELLARHDLTLQVVPHYNLGSLLRADDLASQRVRVLDASTADIPGLLRSCDLLVTDYSSVQFDVAYVGTPVVYCQFDAEEYTAGHSAFSWFETARDGFGPVTRDVEGTIGAIERYAVSGFEREPLYEERVRSVFAHHDRHNGERLALAIDELLRRGA